MKAHVEVVCYHYKPLKDGTLPLMLRITQSRKRKYVSIGVSVDHKYWNFDKNKPKRNCPNKEAIEKLIASKVTEYNNLIVNMTANRQEYTPQLLVQAIEDKTQNRTVVEMYNHLIVEMSKAERLGNLAVYQYSRDSLLKFTHNKLDIPFRDIDYLWLKQYEEWLRNNGCKNTTISQLFRTLRSVFNKAIKNDIVKSDYYPLNSNIRDKKNLGIIKGLTKEHNKVIIAWGCPPQGLTKEYDILISEVMNILKQHNNNVFYVGSLSKLKKYPKHGQVWGYNDCLKKYSYAKI